ncbi:MAG: hypothetical protein ACTSW1_11110 [Candidatus Hodarchaeales archaeon]
MRHPSLFKTRSPLGRLKSLVVISDWINFTEKHVHVKWLYKNQEVASVELSSVIFIPVDFSRIIENEKSYILLYGAGIYWTKFSVFKGTITTDSRLISGLVVPENDWLDSHFNTEPFVFTPSHHVIISDNLQEFPFSALRTDDDDISGYRRRAFGRGVILAQLVFPFKEPLLLLRKATEGYEQFDSPDSPMRVLVSEFDGQIKNSIISEKTINTYEESIPGIRNINATLLNVFPDKWKNEIYLGGLKREIAHIAKDFAFIGAPMILK